ncbi:hypothetical protein [Streptomyces sp. NPDC002346]
MKVRVVLELNVDEEQFRYWHPLAVERDGGVADAARVYVSDAVKATEAARRGYLHSDVAAAEIEAVKIRSKRVGDGSYEVQTNHGVYRVENCPADNPRESGLPAGPRWMITYPGEMTADAERPTKREALEHIRTLHDENETR